ncbi:MAG: DUF3300 domain-containing protein [Burkholderiaceae bacterium]|nr:DUF3300 domain-containing protein [Burkholderiaceae bacterium]
MKARGPAAWLACAAAAATITLAPAGPSQAQQQYDTSYAQAAYAQEELDQMLAPIALYPDAMLAQVLMAATYPLDVVEADRFVRQNPGLTGEALADAVEGMPWDPSVRALTQFPSVLAMMSERLDWTERLGDAFLAQRDQVMDTVQSLRARAWDAGNLSSNDQQQVIVQDQVIAIEPVRPGYLWVPYYNPVVVFGTWWWPDYQPFFWVPPVAYRPPHFSRVYSSGIAWSPYVPLRPRLWHDPRPVWRDRYVVVDNHRVNNVIVTRPGASRPLVWRHDPERGRGAEWRAPDRRGPRPHGPDAWNSAAPDPRWNRPPPPDGRWQGVAPGAPRDYRNGRAPANGEFGQRREYGQPRGDYGQPRGDAGRPWTGNPGPRGEPPAQRPGESYPQRVQKPMPTARGEMPQVAPPPHPWTNGQPPRVDRPAPRAAPVAPPPHPWTNGPQQRVERPAPPSPRLQPAPVAPPPHPWTNPRQPRMDAPQRAPVAAPPPRPQMAAPAQAQPQARPSPRADGRGPHPGERRER